MKWTPEDNKQLEELFNLGKSDEAIARIMNRQGKYSVGKQRSKLGIVNRTMQKGLRRAPKAVIPAMKTNFTVLFYKQDGENHFSFIGEGNPKAAAQNILTRKGVGEVFLLAPKSKLVMQQITEVAL